MERLEWQGVVLSVSYEADWMGMAKRFPKFATSHIEIRTVSPKRAILPVTDTGYRSEFPAREIVERAGGPVAYVRAWLDQAAKAPEWRQQQDASKQLCLF